MVLKITLRHMYIYIYSFRPVCRLLLLVETTFLPFSGEKMKIYGNAFWHFFSPFSWPCLKIELGNFKFVCQNVGYKPV